MSMPKTTGIPRSLLAEVKKLKARLNTLDKNHSSVIKELKSTVKSHAQMLRRQEQSIAQLGRKNVKKEKRKPSKYNLFLKDKMSSGMSMVEAVKAWKEKEASMPSPVQ